MTFDGWERTLSLRVRGTCKGTLEVYLTDENDQPAGTGFLELNEEANWSWITLPLAAAAGDHPLRLMYRGEGVWELAEVRIQ